VLGNDAVDQGKTEPRALADRLGSKKQVNILNDGAIWE